MVKSAGYAVLTMQTGYFKAYYPLEYMTATISSNIQKDEEKITRYIEEARRMGIEILPPDVNYSKYEFSIEGDKIRYGLGGVKGVNKAGIAIILEREKNGLYTDIDDFFSRLSKGEVNKIAINALTLSGGFSSIIDIEDRLVALKEVYEKRGYTYTDEVIEKYSEKMESAVGNAKQIYNDIVSEAFIKNTQVLQLEKMILGTYISSHPLTTIAQPIDWEQENHNDNIIDVTGVISKFRTHVDKNGGTMAFIDLETLEGQRDIVVFARDYESNINKIEVGGIRTFTIKVQMKFGDPITYSYICRNIKYYRG